MKKKILSLGIVSILIAMLLILTGCGNDNNSNNNEQASSNIEENNVEEVSQQETVDGTYTYTYSNVGQEVDGTKDTIILQNGKITFKRDYYDMTKIGTYTVEDNVVVATYTESSSFSEGEDKMITEKISEEEKYNIVDNGLQYSDTYNNRLYVKSSVENNNIETSSNSNATTFTEKKNIVEVAQVGDYVNYLGSSTDWRILNIGDTAITLISAKGVKKYSADTGGGMYNLSLKNANEYYTEFTKSATEIPPYAVISACYEKYTR